MNARTAAVFLVVLLAVAMSLPTVVHAEPQTRVLMALRTADDATELGIQFAMDSGGNFSYDPYYFAFAYGTRDGGQIRDIVGGEVFSHDGGESFEIYHDGETTECDDVVDCPAIYGGSATVGATGVDAAFDVVVFVLSGRGDLRFSEATRGWSLIEVPGGQATAVWSQDSGSTGVHTPSQVSAEAFLGASATTAAARSIAVSFPPCGGLPTGGGVGFSSLTLNGGADAPSVLCPGIVSPGLADLASEPTTWSLDGTAVGRSIFGRLRLVVVDATAADAALQSFLKGGATVLLET